jgi:hypothetical protein
MSIAHPLRLAGLVVVLIALAPLAAAPGKDDPKKDDPAGSNLKGKIEGTKWSSLELTLSGGQRLAAGSLTIEFGKDGTWKYTAGPIVITGTYELQRGDKIAFFLTESPTGTTEHEGTIVIAGDKLTHTDKDGHVSEFERAK